MRVTITAIYLLTLGIAIAIVWSFEPAPDSGSLMFAGVAVAWILSLPWSLLTFLVSWWFMHDYLNPIFLGFFAVCGLLNAILLNLGSIRNRIDDWRYARRNPSR